MNKILYVLLPLLLSISLEANYCIQVSTTNISDKNSILNEASDKYYNQFENVRVESRGNYLVFRVGDYLQYNDARNDINAIRRVKKDAYVRKCDFVREKSIYIQNEREQEPKYQESRYQEPQYQKPKYQESRYQEPQYQKPTKVQQRYAPQPVVEQKYSAQPTVKKKVSPQKYIKKEELTYKSINENDSLWEDCKKCFIPVYKEEEDSNLYVQERPKQVLKRSTPQKQEIEVRVQEPEPTRKSFWSEDTTQRDREYREPSHTSNKFNIDEQFLP